MHAYVINLAHATERWALMEAQLKQLALDYTRIEAVYGDQLELPHPDYNALKYNILHGKTTNKRELGCYFSHIKVLRAFLASDEAYTLVLEDDITLPDGILELIDQAIHYGEHWNLLRLTAFKPGEQLKFAQLNDQYALSYNLKVLKNTAAYVIDRHAAQCILDHMLPMCLPYDVALDRNWSYGFKTACITPLPIPLNLELPGQIPAVKKIRFFRSTTFHAFHLLTHIQRRIYRRKDFQRACEKPTKGSSADNK